MPKDAGAEQTVPLEQLPFSSAISPIPSTGVFTARSSLPRTLPLVAATSMTKEHHGVAPVSPQPAQLWLTWEVAGHMPAHLHSVR